MHAYEPALSEFNIEHFGGGPPDDGEEYTVEDVFTGLALQVSDLISDAGENSSGCFDRARTAAMLFAMSSPEKGVCGARWIARMWENYCKRRDG